MHVGPPPSAPTFDTPKIPYISSLTTAIIRSADKLFFISNLIGSNEAQEWRLVGVAFQESMLLYPLWLQDGRFLVNFYICHPADSWYNVVNQCFWLQYHTDSKLHLPISMTETHLIHLSATLIDYATHHKLSAFKKWVNLTHWDTFIHGPFEFSSVNGRKTQDCVSQTDWNVPKSYCNMFHNPSPCFDVPSYSIHVDHGVHVLFHNTAIARLLISTASHASDTSGLLLPPSSLTKGLGVDCIPSPVLYIYIQTWRSSFEVWHAEMDTLQRAWLFISSIPQESWLSGRWNMVCDLPLHEQTFSPILAGDLATLIKYLWVP